VVSLALPHSLFNSSHAWTFSRSASLSRARKISEFIFLVTSLFLQSESEFLCPQKQLAQFGGAKLGVWKHA
jgi:hypothetical protein